MGSYGSLSSERLVCLCFRVTAVLYTGCTLFKSGEIVLPSLHASETLGCKGYTLRTLGHATITTPAARTQPFALWASGVRRASRSIIQYT